MIVKRIIENTDMDQIDNVLNLGASVFVNAYMESYNPAYAQINGLKDTSHTLF